MPPNTVYVGRPTKWGNKHTVHGYYFAGYVGTLAQAKQICVDCFEDDIDNSLKELSTVELRGKNLACWCALDEPCHADVLLKIANK